MGTLRNIIWQRPNGTLAITLVLNGQTGQEHLALMRERAEAARAARLALPDDHEWRHAPTADENVFGMEPVAFDVPELPADRSQRAAWRWSAAANGGAGGVVVGE